MGLSRLDSIYKYTYKDFPNLKIDIKRDDLLDTYGCTKQRKLDLLFEDIKNDYKGVITVGSFQSNHCRLVSNYANRYDMNSHIILIKGEIEKGVNYNLTKDSTNYIYIVERREVKDKIKELKDTLEEHYFIEGSNYNTKYLEGYADIIKEIKEDYRGYKLPDVYLPVGTGTIYAGLVLGTYIYDYPISVIGISIARDKEKCKKEIRNLLRKYKITYPIRIYDNYKGDYGIPTKLSKHYRKYLYNKTGILLDSCYNSKAFGGMVDIIKEKRSSVIYLNTGGIPY